MMLFCHLLLSYVIADMLMDNYVIDVVSFLLLLLLKVHDI